MDVLFVLGRCRAGFEYLNAARVGAAREGSTERHFNFSSHREEKFKQIWPVSPKPPSPALVKFKPACYP